MGTRARAFKQPVEITMPQPAAPPELLKLDFGCGDNVTPGYVGVDAYAKGPEIVSEDLFKFPWHWKDQSTEHIICNHFFEHIPGKLRGDFMDEVWRILRPCTCPTHPPGQQCPESTRGGSISIISPYASSHRAIQDYTHEWPPVCEESFLYFNRAWRQANKLEHYLCKCDFDYGYGHAVDPMVAARAQESRDFFVKHYNNTVNDIHVTLWRRG